MLAIACPKIIRHLGGNNQKEMRPKIVSAGYDV